MCLRQAKAVSVEGHPLAAYNGVYTHDSTHEGWPVLKNAKGRYLYRYRTEGSWRLGKELTPDRGGCSAKILATEGPLPIGAHTWRCWVRGTEFVDGTLTVGLLVRPPLPSPAACAALPSAHRCPGRDSPAAAPQAELERENGLENL